MRQPAVVERPNLLVLMERNAAPSGGIFGNRMGKSRRMRLSNRPGTANLLEISKPPGACCLVSFLPPFRSEHPVFRAIALSVVLALAVGPGAALVCSNWCDQEAPVASGHHREAAGSSPSVPGDDACDGMVLASAPFFREDVRPVSALDTDDALLVPRYLLACSTSAADARRGPEPAWRLEPRPLSTALRI